MCYPIIPDESCQTRPWNRPVRSLSVGSISRHKAGNLRRLWHDSRRRSGRCRYVTKVRRLGRVDDATSRQTLSRRSAKGAVDAEHHERHRYGRPVGPSGTSRPFVPTLVSVKNGTVMKSGTWACAASAAIVVIGMVCACGLYRDQDDLAGQAEPDPVRPMDTLCSSTAVL